MEKSETNDKLSLLKVSSGLQPEHFDFPQPCNGNLTMTNNSSTYCIESGYIRTGNTCGLTMTQVIFQPFASFNHLKIKFRMRHMCHLYQNFN